MAKRAGNQKYSCHFKAFDFFCFFPAVTLHANGRRTTERTAVPPRRNKDQSRLKFPSPTTEPLLLFFLCYSSSSSSSSLGKTTIPDCHTCLCSRVQGTTTSSVKREEEDPGTGMKKKERNTGIVSSVGGWTKYGSNRKHAVVFRAAEINSHCAATVMSQMRTALTRA